MEYVEGQGLLGRIRFRDGAMPEYDRPYLVVSVSDTYIEILNVSSIRGKEKKLLYPTNFALVHYNPPFLKPSFVKLDSLTRINKSECSRLRLLCGGARLNNDDLNEVKRRVLR